MKQRKRIKRQSLRSLAHYYRKVARMMGITGLGWQLSEYFAGKPMPPVNPDLTFYSWDVERGEWRRE